MTDKLTLMQQAALTALDANMLERTRHGWCEPERIGLNGFTNPTVEALRRKGFCRISAYASRRARAYITVAGRDALRTAQKHPVHDLAMAAAE